MAYNPNDNKGNVPYPVQQGVPYPQQAPPPYMPQTYPVQGGVPQPYGMAQPYGYGYPAQGGAPQPYPAPGFGGYSAPQAGVNLNDHSANTVYSSSEMQGDDDNVKYFGSSFSEKKIRHAFIKKVYLILTTQLIVTVGVICLFIFHPDIYSFVRMNPGMYYAGYAVFIVTYIALVCCPSVRRKWPTNMICLSIFTLALSYMAAVISCFHDTKIVLMSMGITAAICLLLSIFAIQTKFDFTGCGMFLFVACLILFVFGIISIVYYAVTGSYVMYIIYSAGIALLFSMYLVYDTQQIVGGRKHSLSPEEYIYGATNLYLDIVYIFLAILNISSFASD